jgi:hypothetical protein
MNRTQSLRRIRFWLAFFMVGLAVSGLTAFPLERETTVLLLLIKRSTFFDGTGLALWLSTVRNGLMQTNQKFPFLAYGTDWLAFAHLVIAVPFIGPWKDPVRNSWVITFGLIACAGVIPLALIAGAVRGIPFCWRLLDCAFGVVGSIPLAICSWTVKKMEQGLDC